MANKQHETAIAGSNLSTQFDPIFLSRKPFEFQKRFFAVSAGNLCNHGSNLKSQDFISFVFLTFRFLVATIFVGTLI